jgi:hypothetical protein
MSDVPTQPHFHYKRPPIIERVLTVTADIPLENYFARFEDWKCLIHDKFPEHDPITDWHLNIETREDGTPLLTDVQPELTITHRFWRRNSQGKKFLSMRLLPNQLTMNLHPEAKDAHRFEELHAEFSTWLPLWLSHFGGKDCATVSLNYINLISRHTTPQFVTPQGAINVGHALRVFAGLPGQHMGIIPPYDCQMGLMIDPERPATFALRVAAVTIARENSIAIRVDFNAAVIKPKPCLTPIQALSEAEFLHTVILGQFESVFTEEAKKSFEPITV